MNVFASIATLLLPSLLFAAPSSEVIKQTLEAQPTCKNFVRYDDQNLYLGFGNYRLLFEKPRYPIPAEMKVVPFDGSEAYSLKTADGALDVHTEGSTAYVLTFTAVEEWDLLTKERVALHPTQDIKSAPLAYKEHATGMAHYNGTLVISHGRLGITLFDLATKKIKNHIPLNEKQLPYESMATGITIEDNLAYVAMTDFHIARPGSGVNVFKGIVVLDIETRSLVSELGGMDPGASNMASSKDKVIVSFYGMPVWKFNRFELTGSKLPNPEKRISKFPVNGHPTGTASMDDKYYYTCFRRHPDFPGDDANRLKLIPMAMDRQEAGLD